jgi:hypothetical protein
MESYQLFNRFISFRKINSEPEQAKRLSPLKSTVMMMMMMILFTRAFSDKGATEEIH